METNRSLPEGVSAPYDWALQLLRVEEAHAVTRGSPDVVVAVIDLGYRFHPDHAGHLWENPHPTRGDRHGWDFADDDGTLEYIGPDEDTSTYFRGHHAFVVGEVAAVAPACPIMVLRVGYGPGQGGSWSRAVDYAVQHGARVLVIPHGYIQGHCASGTSYFYQGTDFGYPFDHLDLKRAYDEAYAAGGLIVSGVSDNRGRRAAFAPSAFEATLAVGSCDRRGQAADIAPSSDYVEVAAPAGRRDTDDPREKVWGTGGDHDYIPFEGGCMAAGFAGGVAALAFSRYPDLRVSEIREILRNTARGVGAGDCEAGERGERGEGRGGKGREEEREEGGERGESEGWDHRLGYGVLDAAAAVSLKPEQTEKRVAIRTEAVGSQARECRSAQLERTEAGLTVSLELENLGVFDVREALVVVYDGDPTQPADCQATLSAPTRLLVRQLGHARGAVPGLEPTTVSVALRADALPPALYAQAFVCDAGAPAGCHTVRLTL